MILYCDTSALIKLLIVEPRSDQMQAVCSRAEAIAVCRITWAEAIAGLARRQREDPASGDTPIPIIWVSGLVQSVRSSFSALRTHPTLA